MASFGAGLIVGKQQVVCQICQPEEIDFSLFWQTYDQLKEKYVDPQKIDPQQIIYGAISGMVHALGDPYTLFLNPGDSKKFKEDISGHFEGIGIEIGERDNQLLVIAPLEGTPAKMAGLLAGDKIIQIDGKPTIDMTIDYAISLIRGPKGTKVTLTIFREGLDAPKDIEITRSVIDVPALTWELKDIADNKKVAYIKLHQFAENAGFDFSQAAREILNSEAEGIILDLRNNPGGYLEVAQDIAGWFLKQGDVVTIEDFGGKQDQQLYKSYGSSKLIDFPIVVIMNKGTASASEILAGALRDNRGIQLIGEKSFGKGSVQELSELRNGSFLKVTVAHWLTPKGNLIDSKGLEPDIVVEITSEDVTNGNDPQLSKAIEILNKIR